MTLPDYKQFLETKRIIAPTVGLEVSASQISRVLFPFQHDLVRWALRKGRAAIFADTGLGKTFMQLEWARLTNQRTLIVAPLSVAQQTAREAEKLGHLPSVAYERSGNSDARITITNYEMVDHFNPADFGAVVLDESSILKSFDGKTRTKLIDTFRIVPLRLCCTATPAPNDIAEIANHAEFLGVMSRTGMLATFFVHDDEGWRLKRHARQAFYRWLASWGMTLKKPSDLGYSDEGFALPPLTVELEEVIADAPTESLFHTPDKLGVKDTNRIRRDTLTERVKRAADIINTEPDEPCIAWVGLNDEGTELTRLLDGAVLVEGSNSPDEKLNAIEGFLSGRYRVLITKPRIAGFGLNLQHCSRMVFVGLNHSYEQYYQSVRRCYRFGQRKPVRVHVVLSDVEKPIFDNVLRKEREAENIAAELVKNVAEFEKGEIAAPAASTFAYTEDEESGEGWTLKLGDSIERIKEVADNSVDLSVFSPPFQSLFVYSNTERDIGNCSDREEFWEHFGFLIDDLLRVTKPGRNVCCHVSNVALTLSTDGVIGIHDFRGDTIRAFESRGFIYHGEVCIDKDPQAQAIRTHAKGLLFAQKNRDSSWSRPALADYILLFRKPGENAVPIQSDVTNDEWIEFARPVWYGIRESDTLNVAEGRGQEDERHICPLQLGTIDRCVRLWSNPGELVLSPFAGIGSEGFQAVVRGRRFLGIELKPEYFRTAARNLKRAETTTEMVSLFDLEQAS